MGASPAYTSRRYPPTGARGYPEAVTRAPAPRRYLPPRNVGGGGRQVKGRNCDPDCDASGTQINFAIYESRIVCNYTLSV